MGALQQSELTNISVSSSDQRLISGSSHSSAKLPHFKHLRTHLLVKSALAVAVTGLLAIYGTVANGDNATTSTNALPVPADQSAIGQTSKSTTFINESARSPEAPQPTVQNSERADGATNSSAQMTINGQTIAVPQNGSVQQTVTAPGGTTDVSITTQSSGTATNSSSSSTHFSVITTSNGGTTSVSSMP